MPMLKDIFKAIRVTIFLWLLTAFIYPLFILVVGQVFFPEQANGNIKQNIHEKNYGSTLIGQKFVSEKYFQGRPSAVRYSIGRRGRPTGVSGASNLAPSDPSLQQRVLEEAELLREENIPPLAELIYTSGSGLDPHISVEAAEAQIDRVASARNLQEQEKREIERSIKEYTDGRFLGIFGEPGVNILQLNYELDLKDINRN
ncbi:K(+)-transporting ATPase subunit C [Mastigocoleus testarum]|uniref:Potassium-transporting ATPase KdpC subunit n=1 Tax=Mastigocoleus testarum BC008 TaxID=371196 RepID=A0A0V7ZHQ3_9CYAN|nr:K(+)-transporting ATPase subunit C [Mastigocoleus testarum]KST64013.1 potassium-transporting ATPase subunit C [Mastigocoleus testarum BC008]KST64723.1 potassium-transporting ATPase subunit C [Mastigocoleus testarum BC008]